MDDTIKKLGTIRSKDEGRDAVHICVLTMKALCRVGPGEPVTSDGIPCEKGHKYAVGIADPFLERTVEMGEWFYVYLKPASVNGVAHVWKHPAFD